MSIAFVRVNGGTVGTSGTSVTLSGQTTNNGDTCFVCVSGDQTVTSLTTNGTSSVTLIDHTAGGSLNIYLYRVDITSGVTSFTANLGGATASTHVDVIEFSGIVLSDQHGVASGTTSPVNSSTLTPTEANSLFIFASNNANFANGTYTNSWSNWTSPGDLSNAYKIQSGGPASDNTSYALFGNAQWVSVTATFGPTASNAQNAPAGLATISFVAIPSGTASAGVATITFAARSTGTSAGIGLVSFVAEAPTISHNWAAGVSIYAQAPSVTVGTAAGATLAVAAKTPNTSVAANIGVSTFTVAAQAATVSTSATSKTAGADVGRFTVTALTPASSVAAPVSNAAFTVVIGAPKAQVGPVPVTATSAAFVALAPTVTTTTPITGVASLTIVALAPTISTTPVVAVFWHFTPPSEDTVSNISYDAPNPLGNRLMAFFPTRRRGRAVWHLADDSLSFDQPIPTVFPDQAARGDLFPPDSISNLTAVTAKTVYYGGSTYTIDDEEATRMNTFLTDNGYNPNDWLVPA